MRLQLFLLMPLGWALQQPALAQSAAAENLTITDVRRVYSDNSDWNLTTSKGAGNLHRVYSDDSQWRLTLPGHTYTIRRTYSDNFSWSISEAGHSVSFKTVYSQDINQWSVGSYELKTTYRDHFNEWAGAGLRFRCVYSDCTSWSITDQQPALDPAVKGAMVFLTLFEGSMKR